MFYGDKIALISSHWTKPEPGLGLYGGDGPFVPIKSYT